MNPYCYWPFSRSPFVFGDNENRQTDYGNRNNLLSAVEEALSHRVSGCNNFRYPQNQQYSDNNNPQFYRTWPNNSIPRQEALTMRASSVPPNNNNSSTANSIIFENTRLKMDLLSKFSSPEYRAKWELRKNLPVMHQKTAIIQAIKKHQVVLIVGGNGCGKSTQVPQLILDDYLLDGRGIECKIICSQLTKISAVLLAGRVARERNEAMGKSVGFQASQDGCLPRPKGSILYCTNGILLRELQKDPLLRNYTICVLDNIHEHNSQIHQIMGHLKMLLRQRSDFKILMLSPNVVEDKFCDHFDNYYVVYIHGMESAIDLTMEDDEVKICEDISSPADEVISIHSLSDEEIAEPPSKADYDTARAFIKKHRRLDPASLTEQQNRLLIQHKQTVEIYERTNPRKANPNKAQASASNSTELNVPDGENVVFTSTPIARNIKRTLSMDEPFVIPKIPRYESLEDDTELQIAIVDMSNKNGRISNVKWLDVEAKLINDMSSAMWSTDEISFDSVNWDKGIKVITCHNNLSLEFIKSTIDVINITMPNTKLKVVPRSTIPSYNYATVWIPPPIPPIDQILHLIKKQNVGLNTQKWKIVQAQTCRRNVGKDFRLIIDGGSMKYIRQNQGKIKFGLGSIRIRVHRY